MNNENKEFFSNDVESNISENEIVLAPPTELIEEAKEIAQNTKSDEKFPFALQYDANQKDFLLSMLETVGAIVEDDDEEGHMLATMMNMTQLAFIKRLDCVERVISKDLYAMSKNKDKEHYEMNLTNTSQNDIMDNTRAYNNESKSESTSLLLSEGTLKSVNANTICSDCESSNSMETAIQISIGATKYGCICCPGCEVWYKFTVPTTDTYTIYTIGSLDTVGTVYDSNGIPFESNDDYNGKMNFRIITTLSGGATYFIRVKAYGNNTGQYKIKVTDQTLVSHVSVNPTFATLQVGETVQLEAMVYPTNADEHRVYYACFDNDVATVDFSTGLVIAKGVGTAKIYVFDWNEVGLMAECIVTVVQIPVASIEVNSPSDKIVKDTCVELTATVSPTNATNDSITWISRNTNVATIDSSFGIFWARNPGTVVIEAHANDGSGVVGLYTITVVEVPDAASDSWQEMGFVYDGSVRDFNRSEQGLPPYAFEEWITNGRQKVVFMCDYGAFPIAGHSCLLIRGIDGAWYKTQFRGKTPTDSYIECVLISEAIKDEYLSDFTINTLLLYGDYRESLAKAIYYQETSDNKYNGKYHLWDNNCLHYVNEILGYGDNINDDVDNYIANNNRDVPNDYYADLKEILES